MAPYIQQYQTMTLTLGTFQLCRLEVDSDVLKFADPCVHALRMHHKVDIRSLPKRTYVHYLRGHEIGRFGVVLVNVLPRCDL